VAHGKRLRRTIGQTATVCPVCGGGPLLLTESRDRRRAIDLLSPHWDAHAVYREVCTACGTGFPVAPNITEPLSDDAGVQARGVLPDEGWRPMPPDW
jgi:hypothetical protein